MTATQKFSKLADAVRHVCDTSSCPNCQVAALAPSRAANQVTCRVCGLTGSVTMKGR